jgi:uncharacterized protein YcfJ
MNKTLTAITLCALLATTEAFARPHERFVDTARVVSATPIYETVRVSRPVKECWNERVVHRGVHRADSLTGTLAGGILGGVIGNQFGRGDGRTAMTVAGTLLGASIGNDISRHDRGRRYVTEERRCELRDRYEYEEQLVGYRVEYRYKGQTLVTRTREHPGRRIPVRVAVEAVETY